MRNLKRVLSLALALVMMLSLMIVGSSAAEAKKVNFTDKDEITYNEAVDIMVALEVIEGTDKGAFNPKGVLTREAAAKIICYMLLGPTNAENLTTNTSIFTDVAAGRWSAGYISYCAERGILAGTGDGSFNPEGELTGVAFGKMLLVALGYDPAIQGYVGSNWSTAIAADMVNAGIAVNGVVLSNSLTREQAAQMAFQTLEADMVRYATKGVVVNNADGSSVVVGASPATPVSSSKSDDYRTAAADKDETQQFCEKYFPKLTKASNDDDFGRPGGVWKLGTAEICFSADSADATFTGKFSKKELYDVLGNAVIKDLGTVSYIEDGVLSQTGAGTEVDPFVNADVLGIAGLANTANRTTNKNLGGNGKLVEIFVDDDNNVTVVVVNTYLVKASSDYSTKNEELSVTPYGVSLASAKISNEDVLVSNFAKDDLILVTGVKDNTGKLTIKTAELAEVVEDVTVSAYKATKDYVTAGGTKYSYSANAAYDPDTAIDSYNLQKTGYDLILDKYGYVIGVDKHSGEVTLDDILFVKEAAASGFNWLAKVVFMDGTTATVTIAGTQKVSGTEYKAIDEELGSGVQLTADGKISEKRFYQFNVKSNGEYELLDLADGTRQGTTNAVINGGDAQPIAGVTKTANNSTIFIAKNTLYTGVKNSPDVVASDVYYLIDAKNSSYLLAVYTATEGVSTTDASDFIYVYGGGNGSAKDDKDHNYYIYTAVKDGAKGDLNAATNGATAGLYKVNSYENGYAKLDTKVTANIANQLTYESGVASTAISHRAGVVSAGSNSFVMADDAEIYVLNVEGTKKDFEVIDASGVGNIDEGQYDVYAIQKSSSDKTITNLWLVRTGPVPTAVKAVYESTTAFTDADIDDVSAPTTIAGVAVDLSSATDANKMDTIKTALDGASAITASWTVAIDSTTKAITLTAKTAGAIGSSGPAAAPADFTRTTEGKEAVVAAKATITGTITIASAAISGGDNDGKYEATLGSNKAYVTAADSYGEAFAALVTVPTGFTATTEPADSGSSGAFTLTADENGEIADKDKPEVPDGATFNNGKTAAAAVEAVYTLTAADVQLSGKSLTAHGKTYAVTGANLKAQLESWAAAYNADVGNTVWVASVNADGDKIVFTAKTAGAAANASAPANTTQVTAGSDG